MNNVQEKYKHILNNIVFIALKDDQDIPNTGITLSKDLPIPLKLDDVANQAKSVADDFSLTGMIEGMLYVLALDPGFNFASKYEEILLKLDGDMAKKVLKNAVYYANSEDLEGALIHFLAARYFLGGTLDVDVNIGRILLAFYEKEEEDELEQLAKKVFEAIYEKYPESPYGSYYLAFYAHNDKAFTKASTLWREALSLDHEGILKEDIVKRIQDLEAKVNYEKGYSLILRERVEEGMELLQPLEEQYDDWWNLLFFIGLGHRKLGEYDAAIAKFLKVLSLNTGHIQTFNELGICFMMTGQFEEAIKYYLEAIKISNRDPEILCNIAICYINLGDTDEAFAHIQEAKEKSPDDEIVIAWYDEILKRINA